MRLVEVSRKPFPVLAGFVGGRISDHLWLDLANGGSPGFVAVRVVAAGGLTVAYAQISAATGGSELEVIGDDRRAELDAAETALDAFATDGGGHLTWWVDDPDPTTHDLAARAGLGAARALHEMRRPLPHEQRSEIVTRAFRPGTSDEQAWLTVNNRAFAGHAEQGGWTRATLAQRIAADWFDPAGFRLYEVAEGSTRTLAGFCWTKVHPPTGGDPELGEIYVIAADPAFHGRGLGKQLTLAGLDSLSDRGVRTADLYVDAANTPAFDLYQRLGFHIHRTRTAFTGHVAAQPAVTADPKGTP